MTSSGEDATAEASALGDRVLDVVACALGLARERVEEAAGAQVRALLAERLGTLRVQLARAERFAALGRASAAVAHELRNPLSVIETSAFILAERAGADERVARHARRIADQVAYAAAIVGDLLDVARERPLSLAPLDVAQLTREVVADVPHPPSVTLVLDLPEGLPLALADARRIRQVLTNLVLNAIDAVNGHGTLWIAARVEGAHMALAVRDDGPGIPPEHIGRLFDIFFTTKSKGTGLGLPLSRAIVRQHGGDLVATNAAPRGACFTFTLPLAETYAGGSTP